jgi:hypothetical protein
VLEVSARSMTQPTEACHAALGSASLLSPTNEEVLQLTHKGVVRAPMILEAQPEGARDRIRRVILDAADSSSRNEEIELCFSAVLVMSVTA